MIFQFNWFFFTWFEEKERRKTKTKNSFGRVVKLNERPFSMRGCWKKKCLFCFFFPPYLCFYAKRHGHNAIFWGLHKINLQIFLRFFLLRKWKEEVETRKKGSTHQKCIAGIYCGWFLRKKNLFKLANPTLNCFENDNNIVLR
jgi:hypothetical protein